MRKVLTRNLGAKIVSVLFAFFFWLHVTAQKGENQSFRVPLQLTNVPDSLTIVHSVPEMVDVTVRGSKSSLLKMRLFGRLHASVDLSKAVKGRNTVTLSSAVLNLPEELDPRNVTVDSPKILVLNFEKVVTRSIPVETAFKGGVPRDVIIEGDPVIIPSQVSVSGAASIVEGIDGVSTREIDIRNRKGKFSREVDLALEGKNITINPRKVLVEMVLHRRAVRTLANIPPTILQDEEDIEVDYSPRVVSLTIEGPEDLIRDITADDVSVILNISTRRPGTYMVEPEVIVPGGIEKYFLDTEAFEITVSLPSPEGDSE